MRLSWRLLLVAIGVALWCALAIPVRATDGARTTADEPQYLLSALSLAEDLDLDISDERAGGRYRPFHEAGLPRQELPDDDGRAVSPHDPLLPVVLAVPMAVGGWVGAKLAMAAMAGALAATLLWVAVRRFDVGPSVATVVVVAFAAASPLAVYGTQVYPELPAALAVTGAIAALTGPLRRGGVALLVIAVVALPWLSVKYAPVAAVLAALGLVVLWRRGSRGTAAGVLAGLAGAGVCYLVVHQLVYGGWTVYASGDHFVGGELTVMGHDPDYVGRSRRLVGLLLDRGFGLAAWQPGWLLLVPAVALVARRRPPHWAALLLPLAAGWATATWVALTMHGWWWPGRQVVHVLPAAVLAVAWWADRVALGRRLAAAALVVGAATYAFLVVEGWRRDLTLVVDFETTANPLSRAWRPVLPDYRNVTATTWVLQALWLLLGALVVLTIMKEKTTNEAPKADPGPGAGRVRGSVRVG